MAHFGDPICVGAFTDEVRAARDMVNLPLRALGYRFRDENLYLEILAMANYYPSIIQILCRNLLDNLGKEHSYDYGEAPPYWITQRQIHEAYRDSLTSIRERFSWSLDLDRRYKFLAYMIAEELRKTPDGPQELSVGTIRAVALAIWESGFRSRKGLWGFRVLLDEMDGLGILRRLENDRYAIRNRNVMGLLGAPESYEEAMTAIVCDSVEEIPYSADIFRKRLDDQEHRSPLTESQERAIQDDSQGVIVAFGCRAT